MRTFDGQPESEGWWPMCGPKLPKCPYDEDDGTPHPISIHSTLFRIREPWPSKVVWYQFECERCELVFHEKESDLLNLKVVEE